MLFFWYWLTQTVLDKEPLNALLMLLLLNAPNKSPITATQSAHGQIPFISTKHVTCIQLLTTSTPYLLLSLPGRLYLPHKSLFLNQLSVSFCHLLPNLLHLKVPTLLEILALSLTNILNSLTKFLQSLLLSHSSASL